MEGDIKDIVLARMEKRLKDKDEEIRALKDRLNGYENSDRIKSLEDRVEALEAEVRETQTALSEVLKKTGMLEAALASLVAASCDDDECEGAVDPDLALDGHSEPLSPERYDIGVAASPPDAADPEKKDAMRFFRMSKNA